MSRIRHIRRVAAFTVLGVSSWGAAGAQSPPAQMSGRVTDAGTHAPLAGAAIVLLPDRRAVFTDSAGRYVFPGLPTGTVRLLVRATDYPATQVIVDLEPGAVVQRDIELDSTQLDTAELAPVTVNANAPVFDYRLVGFEQRRRTGRGHYLTDDEIKKSGGSNLQDLTRGIPGVTLYCGGGGPGHGCRIHMVRALQNCDPEYYVDGREDDVFGPTTPVHDIVGLEIYTGASEVPGEFSGSDAGCGVIAIWTRSGPPRRTSRPSVKPSAKPSTKSGDKPAEKPSGQG